MNEYEYKQLVKVLLDQRELDEDYTNALEVERDDLLTLVEPLQEKYERLLEEHKQLQKVRHSIDTECNDLMEELAEYKEMVKNSKETLMELLKEKDTLKQELRLKDAS